MYANKRERKLYVTACLSKYLTNQFNFTETGTDIKKMPARSKSTKPVEKKSKTKEGKSCYFFSSLMYMVISSSRLSQFLFLSV